MMKTIKRVDCHKCKYYYVTWEKNFPHGCRAMKFKCKTLPAAAVYESSKMPCMLFKPKLNTRKKISWNPAYRLSYMPHWINFCLHRVKNRLRFNPALRFNLFLSTSVSLNPRQNLFLSTVKKRPWHRSCGEASGWAYSRRWEGDNIEIWYNKWHKNAFNTESIPW